MRSGIVQFIYRCEPYNVVFISEHGVSEFWFFFSPACRWRVFWSCGQRARHAYSTLARSLIGSDISCINTNSTRISIARTTVTACHRSQQCWFQFRKTTKCFERDKVFYINVNYRRQTSINPENQRTNTEIVAILIWFLDLGTCALPFCFAELVQRR